MFRCSSWRAQPSPATTSSRFSSRLARRLENGDGGGGGDRDEDEDEEEDDEDEDDEDDEDDDVYQPPVYVRVFAPDKDGRVAHLHRAELPHL